MSKNEKKDVVSDISRIQLKQSFFLLDGNFSHKFNPCKRQAQSYQ